MTRLPAIALLLAAALPSFADSHQKRVYELRTYFANEGKLEALHARFREHTCAIFEKHGIKNVGYWVPVDNKENKLVYVVSYPSREAREQSWKAFFADADWTKAYKASTREGALVKKVVSQFLTPTDYTPDLKIEAGDPARLFELRTNTTKEGKLADLHKRFRDHTCGIFEKHGIENILYCDPMEDQKGAATTLVYFIAHKDVAARKASWGKFVKDPAWQAARKASVADGPILVKGGVKSELLKPVDYSPMK